MQFPNRIWQPALMGCLAGLMACGGSNGSSAAKSISYSDPVSTGYRLVKDAASTDTNLVLDLVGPSGTQIQGGLFTLTTDTTKATWGKPGTSEAYVLEGGALNLGTGTKLLKSKVSGQTLTGALYQKGTTAAATLGSLPILTVALDLKTGASAGSLNLACTSAQILDAAGTTQTVTVDLGTAIVK